MISIAAVNRDFPKCSLLFSVKREMLIANEASEPRGEADEAAGGFSKMFSFIFREA